MRFRNFREGMRVRHQVKQCSTTWEVLFYWDGDKPRFFQPSSGKIFTSLWNMVETHHKTEDSTYTSRPRSTWDTCEVEVEPDVWVSARELKDD